MSTEPVSPLRLRMIEGMTIRHFGPKTQNDYVRVVRDFTAFLGRSPGLAQAGTLIDVPRSGHCQVRLRALVGLSEGLLPSGLRVPCRYAKRDHLTVASFRVKVRIESVFKT